MSSLPPPPVVSALSTDSPEAVITPNSAPTPRQQPLTMHVILRRDLLELPGWGVGPLIAQAAHAATAVLHTTRDSLDTVMYLSDLPNMRKVVLQTPTLDTLLRLPPLLAALDPPIAHYLWVEMPEEEPTCLAIAPNGRRKEVRKVLDKAGCKLWAG